MPRKDAGEPYYRVSVEEAADMYKNDDTVVIDVRRKDEYEDGHVKDALFINLDALLGGIDELPKDKKLLFICAQGVRSGVAAEMAAAMGFDTENLYNIEEGTGAWIEKGQPTSYGSDK
ncbi:MAG: rhodanese-like domain-containing protein [Chloroflexi bacterium]|nr:rhodanese-like domain-containing protein [Chloroflexota bacterium]MDA1227440.1 rhodanese-like domain-containing protein [Chloroflexota bacterium]